VLPPLQGKEKGLYGKRAGRAQIPRKGVRKGESWAAILEKKKVVADGKKEKNLQTSNKNVKGFGVDEEEKGI